jgi:hypothetical protein
MENLYHPTAVATDAQALNLYLNSILREDCVSVVESPSGPEGVRIIVITTWGVGA